jgi:hypothetical protein
MTDDAFDVIVVGAGLAGIACAGELVLRGKRPLLICETKDVATTLKSTVVAGNLAVPQIATWNLGWGGGWWMSLAKAFNIPIRYYPEPGLELTLSDMVTPGKIHAVPRCPTASGMTQMLVDLAPWPIDPVVGEFEKVLDAALTIPHEELWKMEDVPVGEWLDGQGCSDMVAMLIQVMLATFTLIEFEAISERVSMFGAFGMLRTYLNGDGVIPVIHPDNREGLAFPLARAIEQRGGEIWRGRKVDHVITDGGVATGVVLIDGTEVHAPAVAVAVGNPRIPKIFDALPPELEAPLAAGFGMVDFYTYTTLDRPVASNRPNLTGFLSNTGMPFGFSWPMQAIAPWTTQPGQQLIIATSAYSPKDLAALGGPEAAYAKLNAVHELYFPGFSDAIVEQATQSHTHLWYDQLSAGPKVPRTIDSVRNLWFVGEGSTPIRGVGFEAAASAGILGARSIASASLEAGARP